MRDFTRDFKACKKAADAGEVFKIATRGKAYLFHSDKTPPKVLGCMAGTVKIVGSLELDEEWEASK